MDITITEKGLEDVVRAFGHRPLVMGTVSALNKVAAQARTRVSATIRARYAIRKRDLDQGLKLAKARAKAHDVVQYAELIGSGSPIPLGLYSPTQSGRRGLQVAVLKGHRKRVGQQGRTWLERIASGSSRGHAYRRVLRRTTEHTWQGGKRVPRQLRELFGPSIPSMLTGTTIVQDVLAFVQGKYPEVFQHELLFAISREIASGRVARR